MEISDEIIEQVDPESDQETNSEMLGVAEEAFYDGLNETKKAMVSAIVQPSLVETTIAAPSGATVTSDMTR